MNCPALRRVGHCNPEGAAIVGLKSEARFWAPGTKGTAGECRAGRSQRPRDEMRRQPALHLLPTLAHRSPLPRLLGPFLSLGDGCWLFIQPRIQGHLRACDKAVGQMKSMLSGDQSEKQRHSSRRRVTQCSG